MHITSFDEFKDLAQRGTFGRLREREPDQGENAREDTEDAEERSVQARPA